MKKVLSSALFVFSFPFSILKKSKIDNFAGGLIFGAVFSLIVNIATVQIQESIQKQRILEAVEYEILSNVLQADSIMKYNQKAIQTSQTPNYFYTTQRYTRDLWEQSSEPLQYIVQLDQNVQTAITSFYSVTIPRNNQMLEKVEELRVNKLEECFNLDNKTLSQAIKDSCDSWHKSVMQFEINSAASVATEGVEILKKFHPTKDRLGSPFLKLLIGDKSTRILSGK